MRKQLTAIIEREGDGYVSLCPELDIASQGNTVKEARENLERTLVKQALATNGQNLSRAATDLGISRPTLYDLVKKHGLNQSGTT